MLGLLAIVPTLLAGPVLAGSALLVHDHGGSGGHVHVVSAPEGARPGPHSARHEHGPAHGQRRHAHGIADERREHGHGVADEQREHGRDAWHGRLDASALPIARPSEGPRLLISVPVALHLASPGSPPITPPAPPAMPCSVADPRARSRDVPASVAAGPPGRTGPGKQRSGVAAVLTASGAIRI